jgi:hypothetical protein
MTWTHVYALRYNAERPFTEFGLRWVTWQAE